MEETPDSPEDSEDGNTGGFRDMIFNVFQPFSDENSRLIFRFIGKNSVQGVLYTMIRGKKTQETTLTGKK